MLRKRWAKWLPILLSLTLIFPFGITNTTFAADTVVTLTTIGSNTWTCPAGVSSIKVELWGGGGGSARARNGTKLIGGGGGGAYTMGTLTVTPGTAYSYTVGAGGTGGTSSNNSGGNGVNSTFQVGAITLTANGGRGSSNANGAAGGAASTGTSVTTSYKGGDGANAGSTYSGGGGGGAGRTGDGGNAATSAAGAGNTPGGNGGAGRSSQNTGANGLTYGGGAGGAFRASSQGTNQNGGNGAPGQIVITYTAIPTYALTMAVNTTAGGAATDSTGTSPYIAGKVINITATANNGYTFSSWTSSSGGSFGSSARSSTTFTMPPNATTVTAIFTAATQTITYNANNGTGTAMANTTGLTDSTVTLAANSYSRNGYTFIGWNTNASATTATYTNGQSLTMPAGGLTLYAIWSGNPQTITYNANDGTGAAMASTTGATGASVTLRTNTYTNTGKVFIGWNTDSAATTAAYTDGQTITMPAGGLSLYAVWGTRTALSVLEVEPGTNYLLPATATVSNYDVTVTRMPMTQFISMVDSINGKYDIVVIGNNAYTDTVSNTHYDLTRLGGSANVTVGYSAAGLHYPTTTTGTTFALPQGGTTDSYENYYVNDVTNRKAADVDEYLKTGQLTVFADSILSSSSTIKDTILYNKFHTYRNNLTYPNFKSVTTIDINDLVSKYASANKRPTLNLQDQPLEYDGTDGTKLTDNRVMSYGFYLTGAHTMTASLYIDANGDGIFTATEKMATAAGLTSSGNNDSPYALNYRLPDAFTGLQPWKLVITDETTGAKTYTTGYTAFKGIPLNVRVLQLVPSGSTLNVKTDMLQPLTATGEYTISVTVMNVTNFDNAYAGSLTNPSNADDVYGVSQPTKLDGNYDMIIMGFADTYGGADLKNANAITALKNFIASGQSVMFTHDTMTFATNSTSGWDYNLTKNFRDLIGQNIYQKDAWNADAVSTVSHVLKRLLYPVTTNNSFGFTRIALDRANNGGDFPTATSTAKLNDGLITKYPYILGNTLSVASTHYQYYQLDLEDPTLVPWFTLSGTGYNSWDGRNDYYTYTKGNITYSGTGHSTPNNAEEHKLFINTIIKASRGANHAPIVGIYDIKDGQEIYTDQTTLNFSFQASDLDVEKDKTLKASITLTYNGTDYPVTDFTADGIHYTPANLDSNKAFTMNNNSIVTISMPQSVPTTKTSFKLTVKAKDTSNATGSKTITLNLVSPPSMKITAPQNNYYLVNDTATTTFSVIPNSAVKDMTNVVLTINKDQSGIASITNPAGGTVTDNGGSFTIKLPDYAVSTSSPNHWSQQTPSYQITFTQKPITGTVSINYTLSYQSLLNNVLTTRTLNQSVDYHVNIGEIRGDIKDDKGRVIKNTGNIQNITLKNASGTVVATTASGSTGAYLFTGVKTGSYTVTVAEKTGYTTSYKFNATGTLTAGATSTLFTLSNSATDNTSYQKEVDFVLSGTMMNQVKITASTVNGGTTNSAAAKCIPKGTTYASIQFTALRPLATMKINLANTLNGTTISNLSVRPYKLKLNGTAISVKNVVISGNTITLPDDLAAGSYELIVAIDAVSTAKINDVLRVNISSIYAKDPDIDETDTLTPPGDAFGNTALSITIVTPNRIY
ncbi:DUF5057 domain-containing protein [Dehalobacter sp. DCM]|uniref:DUF5057 domain-containing protein n=1 Tax=Dehalobacter sp. DCM TaxID=2907827 RepID=UPI003081D7C2|nr:DUF5057 domain-containing protein [Dehalobacter sp. DCM]